jgi:hypothetical protein
MKTCENCFHFKQLNKETGACLNGKLYKDFFKLLAKPHKYNDVNWVNEQMAKVNIINDKTYGDCRFFEE